MRRVLARYRLLARRSRPSARQAKQLTALERATGWRYQIVATNITRVHGVAGSHQPQWLDALHRAHAGVETRVSQCIHTVRPVSWPSLSSSGVMFWLSRKRCLL